MNRNLRAKNINCFIFFFFQIEWNALMFSHFGAVKGKQQILYSVMPLKARSLNATIGITKSNLLLQDIGFLFVLFSLQQNIYTIEQLYYCLQ